MPVERPSVRGDALNNPAISMPPVSSDLRHGIKALDEGLLTREMPVLELPEGETTWGIHSASIAFEPRHLAADPHLQTPPFQNLPAMAQLPALIMAPSDTTGM